MIKVLIQGHPYDFYSKGHWMKEYIEQRSEIDYPGTVVQYETADIKEGGTHVMNFLHVDYKFVHSFDTLWLPDLGGDWYNVQDKFAQSDIQKQAHFLLRMIKIASVVVKPGGHVYVSKFISQPRYGYDKDELIEQIVNLSNQEKTFHVAEKKIMMYGEPGIHFVRNQETPSFDLAEQSHHNELRLRLTLK